MKSLAILTAVVALALAPTADARPSQGDPVRAVDRAAKQRGGRGAVMVLGTAHLSALPADFDRTRFGPLIERLARFAPERIAIESLSGAQCMVLRSYAHAYPDVADNYCPDPAAAQAALGFDGPAADKAIDAILAEPRADRPAPQRRRLAALFLAAGEPGSALVQWLRLPLAERVAGDGLTGDLAAYLSARQDRLNEDYQIAAPLAARLGHERLYPVDDHTSEAAAGLGDEERYGAEITAIWANPASAARKAEDKDWQKRLAAGGSVVDWLRMLNTPREQRLIMAGDFAAAAGATGPGMGGRRYLAYWETRNLRMVANLRETIGAGHRTLAIVGASHASYYTRYLGMLSDVEIVPITRVLGD